MAGKTEVSLEFSGPSSSSKSQGKIIGDEMIEIRFHVPGTHTKLKSGDSDAGSQIEVDDDEEISAAQVFHDTIKDKAVIGQEPGDLVLSFEEVLVLTPRGRYDMDMYLEFLRLRGKTYDYKIEYSHISRMFLLPKDDQHVLFIVCPFCCDGGQTTDPQHCFLARLEITNWPGSNPLPIPCNAIQSRGGNHCRAEYERVSHLRKTQPVLLIFKYPGRRSLNTTG